MRDLHVSHTLGYTVGLEHLKIKTLLVDEKFASVMGECVFVTPSVFRVTQTVLIPTPDHMSRMWTWTVEMWYSTL
jgi:hypothetical protein